MKTSLIVTFVLLAFGALQGAMAESLQERLLKAEMELASATAGGLADRHPNIRSSKAEIGVLKGRPGIFTTPKVRLRPAKVD